MNELRGQAGFLSTEVFHVRTFHKGLRVFHVEHCIGTVPPALRTFHVEHFNSATNKFGLVKSVPRGTLLGGTGRSDMFHVEHSRASDSICRLGSHVNLPTWHMDAPIL
jgi:hypothetical protein